MKKVTKQNKSEMGMNRNEFFEYKKNRIVELAKKGADIETMAKDLGIGENDMYAFLSRNFGGIRRLRESVKSGFIPEFRMAAMTIEEPKKNTNKGNKAHSNGKSKRDDKPLNISKDLNQVVNAEREKILMEFKQGIEKDGMKIIEEVRKGLDQVKGELLTNFKADIMRELSGLANSL